MGLFVIQSNYMQTEYSPVSAGYTDNSMVALNSNTVLEESGNLYTIKKVYKEDPTATTFYREDRFRIVLDKNLPFAGTDLSQQSPTVLAQPTRLPRAPRTPRMWAL